MELTVVINMMKFIHAQITWIALLLYHWLCWIGIDQDWSLIKICFTYVLSLLFFFCRSFLGDTQFWKRCVAFCIKLRKMWVADKFLHATSLFPKLLCFRNGSCKSNTENDLSEWKNHVRFFSVKCFQDFAVRRRCGEMFIRNGDTYPVVKCSIRNILSIKRTQSIIWCTHSVWYTNLSSSLPMYTFAKLGATLVPMAVPLIWM